MKQQKTNVMRLLDAARIEYEAFYYDTKDNRLDGVSVADKMGQNKDHVFKTLVTISQSGSLYVFVIPVQSELNLKKAAAAVKEKNVVMIPQKDLLPTTGYIHGGCSPIGMKKPYPVTVHSSAADLPKMVFSGGKVGTQVCMAPNDLIKMVNGKFADITN